MDYCGEYETWQLGALAMREPRFEKFAEAARDLCDCDPYYEWIIAPCQSVRDDDGNTIIPPIGLGLYEAECPDEGVLSYM